MLARRFTNTISKADYNTYFTSQRAEMYFFPNSVTLLCFLNNRMNGSKNKNIFIINEKVK